MAASVHFYRTRRAPAPVAPSPVPTVPGKVAVLGNNPALIALINALPGHSAQVVTQQQIAEGALAADGYSALFYAYVEGEGPPPNPPASAAAVKSWVGTGTVILLNGNFLHGLTSGDPVIPQLVRNAVQLAAASGRGFVGVFGGALAGLTSHSEGDTVPAMGFIDGAAEAITFDGGGSGGTMFTREEFPAAADHALLQGVPLPHDPQGVHYGAMISGVDPALVVAWWFAGVDSVTNDFLYSPAVIVREGQAAEPESDPEPSPAGGAPFIEPCRVPHERIGGWQASLRIVGGYDRASVKLNGPWLDFPGLTAGCAVDIIDGKEEGAPVLLWRGYVRDFAEGRDKDGETTALTCYGPWATETRADNPWALTEPTPTPIEQFAARVFHGSITRRLPGLVLDIQPTGEMIERTVTGDDQAVLADLAERGNAAVGFDVTGFDGSPGSGSWRGYFRPIATSPSLLVDLPGELTGPSAGGEETSRVANVVYLTGGDPPFPNLLASVTGNTHFAHATPAEPGTGNLLLDSSFEADENTLFYAGVWQAFDVGGGRKWYGVGQYVLFSGAYHTPRTATREAPSNTAHWRLLGAENPGSPLIWELSGGASIKEGPEEIGNARSGKKALLLDNPGEAAAQTVYLSSPPLVAGQVIRFEVPHRRKIGNSPATGEAVLSFVDGGGVAVGTETMLPLAPLSTNFDAPVGAATVPPGAVGVRLRAECLTAEEGGGLVLDDLSVYPVTLTQQGWEGKPHDDSHAVMLDWAYTAETFRGPYSVLLDVIAFNQDNRDYHLRPKDDALISVAGNANLRGTVWLKSYNGEPVPPFLIEIEEFEGSNKKDYAGRRSGVISPGVLADWTPFHWENHMGAEVTQASFHIVFRGSGRVLVGAAQLRDASQPEGEFVPEGPLKATLRVSELFAPGTPEHQWWEENGDREESVTEESITTPDAARQWFVAAFAPARATPIRRPNVALHGRKARHPGLWPGNALGFEGTEREAVSLTVLPIFDVDFSDGGGDTSAVAHLQAHKRGVEVAWAELARKILRRGGGGGSASTSYALRGGGGSGSSGAVVVAGDLSAHINNPTGAHAASAISATAPAGMAGGNVQALIDELADGGASLPDLVPSPAGTYGSATKVAVPTVDAKGRVTAVSEVAITGGGGGGGTATPSVIISTIAKPTTINFTTEGAKDWVLWNTTSLVLRKAFGGDLIGGMNFIGRDTGTVFTQTDPTTVTFTDGLLSPSGSQATRIGIFRAAGGVGYGFRFHVPVDTFSRTLRIYGTHFKSNIRITCRLTDGSLADVTNAAYDINNASLAQDWAYEIIYNASLPGQRLLVSVTMIADYGSGNVCMVGATLA